MEATATFEVSLTNFTLYIQFDSWNIGDVTAEESQIGDIDTKAMKTLINLGLKIVVPMLNLLLSKGF